MHSGKISLTISTIIFLITLVCILLMSLHIIQYDDADLVSILLMIFVPLFSLLNVEIAFTERKIIRNKLSFLGFIFSITLFSLSALYWIYFIYSICNISYGGLGST